MNFNDVSMRVLNALSNEIKQEIQRLEKLYHDEQDSKNFESLVEYLQTLSEKFKADDRMTAVMLVNEILEPIWFDKFLESPELLEDYLSEYLTCLKDLIDGLCDVNGDNLKYTDVKQELELPRLSQLKSLIQRSYEKSEADDLVKIIESF